MSDATGIEWTDATWNPWYGCKKVSQGCKNCYMYREQKQYGRDPMTVTRSKTKFNDPLKWAERPARVFTCSWSDFFIEEADEWRAEAWKIIWQTPYLTYQVLTKRPENIASRLPENWGSGYPNVWLGASVEDQPTAFERIPKLISVPAYCHFISCEPLLGKTYISYWDDIEWVICGGESGPNCRPMDLEWARLLLKQCQWSDIPFFFKQVGGWPNKRGKLEDIPEDLRIREYPA